MSGLRNDCLCTTTLFGVVVPAVFPLADRSQVDWVCAAVKCGGWCSVGSGPLSLWYQLSLSVCLLLLICGCEECSVLLFIVASSLALAGWPVTLVLCRRYCMHAALHYPAGCLMLLPDVGGVGLPLRCCVWCLVSDRLIVSLFLACVRCSYDFAANTVLVCAGQGNPLFSLWQLLASSWMCCLQQGLELDLHLPARQARACRNMTVRHVGGYLRVWSVHLATECWDWPPSSS